MSKRVLPENLKFTKYEDMFDPNYTSGPSDQKCGSNIVQVQLSELFAFRNHPFKVIDDDKMDELVQSIRENGILVPAIARPLKTGGYELISGHRRHHAAKIAGLSSIPVIIQELDDDAATVIMVDANLQREEISISEKSKAYKMKYDAMKHQGSNGGSSLEAMSADTGESQKTIQRLIAIADVDNRILSLVDAKKLGIRQTLEIASLDSEHQNTLYDIMAELGISISTAQATQIKEAYKKGFCSEEYLRDYLSEKKKAPRVVSIKQKSLDNYFPPEYTNAEIENIIFKLLDQWKSGGDM